MDKDSTAAKWAAQARAVFVRHAESALAPLPAEVEAALLALLERPSNMAEANERRDAYQLYARSAPAWMAALRAGLQALIGAERRGGAGAARVSSWAPLGGSAPAAAVAPVAAPAPAPAPAPAHAAPAPGALSAADIELPELSLVAEDAVETELLAARAALAAVDRSNNDFNDLRLRLQHLDGSEDLARDDAVQPLSLTQVAVEAWLASGLSREHWQLVQPVLHAGLARAIAAGHTAANQFLLDQGVLPEIDWRGLVRRAPAAPSAFMPTGFGAATEAPAPHPAHPAHPARAGAAAAPSGPAPSASAPAARPASAAASVSDAPARLMRFLAQRLPGSARWRAGGTPPATPAAAAVEGSPTAAGAGPVAPGAVPAAEAGAAAAGAAPETAFPYTEVYHLPTAPANWQDLGMSVAGARQQARAFKSLARNDDERAVIEVVALIFDSILAEDRIPASIRVWFARLQMPVLRLAVRDDSFLSDLAHPARQLLDRMGHCVLGFDPAVSIEPLEQEIKRIVQVIEQYPETGRRVFELMLDEFQAFLARQLPERGAASRVANVAQQIEQKETLTVQYTIELRKLLAGITVPDAVREFLFHTWAEAMAVSTVRHGIGDGRSRALRQAAGDLLWTAGSKSSRQERAQVIAKLPQLLEQLRQGMGLLGYDQRRQDLTVKRLSDALAEAFMSRTSPIDPAWLASMTEQLASLEQQLPEAELAALTLDQDSIELITGVDASNLTVLARLPEGAAALREDALVQADALEPGQWFELEHNGQPHRVQLAWRSAARQLLLFVSAGQACFLMQRERLAQYLQAGLMQACEPEPLTERATRAALDKLDANPERLLA